MKLFTRPFRQLRGKLTLSYTLTSIVAFLLVEVTALALISFVLMISGPNVLVNNLTQDAPQAASYFTPSGPDRTSLTAWLQGISDTVSNEVPFTYHPIFLSVVDRQGQIIASVGPNAIPIDTPVQDQLSAQGNAQLREVLLDNTSASSMVSLVGTDKMVVITPIKRSGGNVDGALVIAITVPDRLQPLEGFLNLILLVVIIVTATAGFTGLIFGYLTARGLTRRLKGLSVAAERWSRGEFSVLAQDGSEDELGQLGRQLNRMAEQLRNLLQTRQKLAILEERNRLARDLHDSVKQQVFAVAMQIGASQTLLKRDPSAAEARLKEAQKLVSMAQKELTSLILELRPAGLEGKSIATALRELTKQWMQQTNIAFTLHIEGEENLPLIVEEALYRVAQEALSNITRHSQATQVHLKLSTRDDEVTLSITDNGQGFDSAERTGSGVGLLSMQERMKTLGGDVWFESIPGIGTSIIAQCKLQDASSNDVTGGQGDREDRPYHNDKERL